MAIEIQEIVKTANEASAKATVNSGNESASEPAKAKTERKFFALPVAPCDFVGAIDIQMKIDEMFGKAKNLAVLTPIEAAASTFILQPQLYDLCATGVKNEWLALPGVKRNDANTGWIVTTETIYEVNRRFLYHIYEKLCARAEDFDSLQAAKLGNGHKAGVVSAAYIAKKAEELTDEEFDAIVAARAAKRQAAKIVDAVLAEVDAK